MDERSAFAVFCLFGSVVAFSACSGGAPVGARMGGAGGGAVATGGSYASGGQTGAGNALGTIALPGSVGSPTTRTEVDPSVPAGATESFGGASSPDVGKVQIVYPNPNALIPHDLAAIDVQWNVVAGATAYQISFSVDTGDRLLAYVSAAHYVPSRENWSWLLDRAAGHTLELQVAAATLDSVGARTGTVRASMPQALRVSHDDATGALFYFGTSGSQVTGSATLFRLPVGAAKPAAFINGSITNGLCVGCHTMTRDGKRMSFAYDNVVSSFLGSPMTLGNVDVTNPAQNLAPTNTPSVVGTFNPDGTRLLTSNRGKLTLRDGATGMPIADVATSGPAMYPDWSPDGSKVVFVRPGAACTPGGLLGSWGQDSIIVFGGALVTIDYDAATGAFGNEQALFPSNSRNAYYPAYSPDGNWIAFTRTDGVSKMSWSGANTACIGVDGTAGSYDNPSATTWLLPAKGGEPVELTQANGEPMRTNSWPKWGPRKDGEYLWLSFTSTRPYGNVLTGANAHHQLWITGIRAGSRPGSGDPSAPAVWFPFQDTVTKNHIGMWSVNATNYVIP